MARLVVMAGLPGSGKSTLARALADVLPAVVLDKDIVRAALFTPADIEYSARQDDFCIEVMMQVAAYLWERDPHRTVIVDGRPFAHRAQRTELVAFAARTGTALRFILCACADDTAYRRLADAAADGRHPALNRDAALYRRLQAAFESFDTPYLHIDTDDDLATCVARCLADLRPRICAGG